MTLASGHPATDSDSRLAMEVIAADMVPASAEMVHMRLEARIGPVAVGHSQRAISGIAAHIRLEGHNFPVGEGHRHQGMVDVAAHTHQEGHNCPEEEAHRHQDMVQQAAYMPDNSQVGVIDSQYMPVAMGDVAADQMVAMAVAGREMRVLSRRLVRSSRDTSVRMGVRTRSRTEFLRGYLNVKVVTVHNSPEKRISDLDQGSQRGGIETRQEVTTEISRIFFVMS
jgi:hypothetical protein